MYLYLKSLIIICLEISCCKIFFEIFVNKKRYIKTWMVPIWGVLFIGIDFGAVILFSKNIFLKQILVILIYSVFMGIYFGIINLRVLIYSILFQTLLLTIDYTILIFIQLILKGEVLSLLIAVHTELLVILSKSVLFVLVLIIKKLWKSHQSFEIMSNREWIKLLSFSFMTIFTIISLLINFDIVNNSRQIETIFVIACALVSMDIIQFYLIDDIMKKEEKIRENELYKVKIDNQMALYFSMSENLEKQRQAAHEYKNKIICIESLLLNKKYYELEKYVCELNENIMNQLNVIDTNNIIVNAILNTKYQEAKKKDILLVFRVNDLSEINISDSDMVILLSNLLNNAIEASQYCTEKRIIKVKMVYEDRTLILSVKNNYSHLLNMSNDMFNTTKISNSDEHGIGLKNVIQIIEKYGGSYAINTENNEFKFTTLIER